jgi:hypothetical protein
MAESGKESSEGREAPTSSEGRDAPTRGTAPSSPDIDSLEKFEASDEAKAHEPSQVDAMGDEKRRQVVGHSYGPSKRSQIMFFVAVGVILVVIVGGWTLAVAAFDQPPDSNPDKAPWSAADAPQIPTRDPSGPCGEPGNAFPPPADSPCVTGVSSSDEAPPSSGTTEPRQEQGSGGSVGGGSESEQGGKG